MLHTIASFYYISRQNITFDEPQYIEYAKRWLHGRPERVEPLDDSKSPIIAICWVPRIVRQVVNPHYQLKDYGRKDQQEGRYMMIFFSLMAAVYVYRWCKDLYGVNGWILLLLLLLFDPMFLSYSMLINTDLACGAFLVALLFHYRRYVINNSRNDFYLTAVLTGFGIVTKQTLLFTVLLLPSLSLLHNVLEGQLKVSVKKKSLLDAVLFFAIILVVINGMYYFNRSFIPFGDYSFESNMLRSLQQNLAFLHWLPIPLPENFVKSVDMLKAHADLGAGHTNQTYNGVYLFGQLKLKGGFWYYYLVTLWYKLPLGTLVILLASVVIFFKKFDIQVFAKQYIFIIIPILFYWFILSFINQFQTGLRHLLVIYPLLFIGLGYTLNLLIKNQVQLKVLAGVLVVSSLVSVATYYPYLVPYTNEFITEKKTVYKKIYDSTIDYGQADSSVNYFLEKHPGYRSASPVPDTGKFVVPMGEMMGTYLRENNPYNWYKSFEPKDQFKYTLLLYSITNEDLKAAGYSK